jgi:hypothetical protein
MHGVGIWKHHCIALYIDTWVVKFLNFYIQNILMKNHKLYEIIRHAKARLPKVMRPDDEYACNKIRAVKQKKKCRVINLLDRQMRVY